MRITGIRLALSAGAALALALVAAGAGLADPSGSSHNGFWDPASPVARDINGLFWIVTLIAAVVGIVVESLIYLMIRRHRVEGTGAAEDAELEHHAKAREAFAKRGGDPRLYRAEHGNAKVEIYIFIGTAAAFAMLVLASLNTLWAIENPPEDPNALTVNVTGSQWAWEFEYPALGVTELAAISEMHVPVNTVVKLNLRAVDVIHAVWIPDLGVKVDAVPGHVNHFWFIAEREGRYLLQCAEFCGGAHSDMHGTVVVESQAAFDQWVDLKVNPPPPPPPPVLTGDVVNVTLSEYSMAFDRTLNIEVGSTVTFRISNTGTVQHALHFEAPNDQTSPLVDAGTTVLWDATFATEVANAVVSCPVTGHAGQGMTDHYRVSKGARVVDVYLHDSGVPGDTYSITPAKLELTPGEKVSFRVHNEGTVAHNLKLGEPYNVVSATINGGQSTLMQPITVAESADSYWCDIPGHRQLGMEGSFGGAQVSPGAQVPGFDAALGSLGLLIAALAVSMARRRP